MTALIAECRLWWRFASTWAMAFWAALGGIIVAMWPVASWYLNQIIPDGPLRVALGGLVTAVTFGSMLFARLRKQPKLEEKRNAE